MKIDFEMILAALGLQTAGGVLFGDWSVGACAALGFFAGMLVNRAPVYLRTLIVPAAMAVMWAFIGPKLLAML